MSLSGSDAAYNYALVLAFRQHILEEETRRNAIEFGQNQGDAETIEFQDSLANLQQIRTFVFNKLLTYYMDQDTYVDESMDEKAYNAQKSLAYNFPHILLKPANVDSTKLDTASIIDCLDRPESSRVLRSNREGELAPRFYLILKKVVELHENLHLSTSEVMNVYAAGYIQRILANYTEFFDKSSTLLMKLDAASSFLTRDYTGPHGSMDTLFTLFKLHLSSHLEFAKYDIIHQSEENLNFIYQLREQGNNLMAILSYPQAIKVYTVALENVTFHSNSNTPQLLTNRALAYIALNCFPEAISDLNAAIHYERSFTAAWTQLGYCHLYMGKSLLALRAYLVALRTTVGEILPHNFPVNNATLVARYRETKVRCVLPQFIQRLCLSISLTETRAYQQAEPAPEIRKIVNNVRRILAILRAECADQDREFFTYFPHLRDNMFRTMSETASRNRIPAQNQFVHQNMFSNSGEPVAVGISEDAPTLTTQGVSNNPFAPDATDERGRQNTRSPQAAASGLRNFLNDFGGLFDQSTEQQQVETNVIQTNPIQIPQTNLIQVPQTNPIQNAEIPQTNPNQNPQNNPVQNSQTNQTPQTPQANPVQTALAPSNPSQPNMILQNVLRNVLPGGIGEMLAQISGSNGTTSRVIVNGQPVTTTRTVFTTHSSQTGTQSTSESTSDGNTPSAAPPNAEDVEMSQVPEDLD